MEPRALTSAVSIDTCRGLKYPVPPRFPVPRCKILLGQGVPRRLSLLGLANEKTDFPAGGHASASNPLPGLLSILVLLLPWRLSARGLWLLTSKPIRQLFASTRGAHAGFSGRWDGVLMEMPCPTHLRSLQSRRKTVTYTRAAMGRDGT